MEKRFWRWQPLMTKKVHTHSPPVSIFIYASERLNNCRLDDEIRFARLCPKRSWNFGWRLLILLISTRRKSSNQVKIHWLNHMVCFFMFFFLGWLRVVLSCMTHDMYHLPFPFHHEVRESWSLHSNQKTWILPRTIHANVSKWWLNYGLRDQTIVLCSKALIP